MKASKFSDAQKVFILKQGDDGVLVVEICRKAGISQGIHSNRAGSMQAFVGRNVSADNAMTDAINAQTQLINLEATF